MTPEDLDRIATRLERTAELLRERGTLAVDLARRTRGHLRAANPSGGGRSSIGDHSDPTGSVASDDVDHDALFETRLLAAINSASTAAGVLTDILATTIPLPKPPSETKAPSGSCQSCFRDKGYLEPEDTHADGRVRHRAACAWCAGFLRDYKRLAPVELLEKRHRGGRITTLDINQALSRKHRRRKGA